MLIRTNDENAPPPSEITTPQIYAQRRRLMQAAGLSGLLALPGAGAFAAGRFDGAAKSPFSTSEKPNSLKDITSYNNFYEFGTAKEDPARHAHKLRTRPWTVAVDGLVKKPATFAIDDLLATLPLEERIYRLRCVEGWSMVIPWIGFPLAALLKRVEPLGSARYVEFTSAFQKDTMPGVWPTSLQWPYAEGLRLDEALHPLTLIAVGLYGDVLPNQNGAPLRLVVPWKYGFKSGKSIVRIRLVEKQPATAWNLAQPSEYGFYSNVNPEVAHPRWSQATERRLGEFSRRKTLPFNGYAEQVASLYTGMDLRANF